MFSALLNYRYNSSPIVAEVDGGEWSQDQEATNYPVVLAVEDFGHALGLTAQVVEPIAPERVCGYMQRALEQLAGALESGRSTEVRALDVLPPAERRELVAEWNETEREYPRQTCMHVLFEQQVARTPSSDAVMFEAESLSYTELNTRSNQLARHLAALGVGAEMLVGIAMERSLDMVVSLFAVLKTGAAYVPLDPDYPSQRLAYMLDNARPRVVLTHERLRSSLPFGDQHVVAVDATWFEIARNSGDDLGRTIDSNQLAYVLYTSGSTGNPKGVQITHRALTNFLCSMQQDLTIGASDTLAAVTSLSFDIAGLELYLPLLTGARVVIVPRSVSADGGALVGLLHDRSATVMQATPTTWRLICEAGWTGAPEFQIWCGGEAMPRELAAQLVTRGRVTNLYGPTETTIWSSLHVLAAVDTIPIGHPIANTQLHILDERLELVPPGAVGELYIGGDGLARGYLGRPDLTAEKFLPNPFGMGRLYRTGDLARRLADGTIECLGRVDHQVKIRGFRIELGEIEAQLERHASVREGVVVVREDVPGDRRLVAYVVGATPVIDLAVLRAHLREALPEYMVPSLYVVLEAIPLTPNGKIDRKALPAPEQPRSGNYESPRTPIEERLAAIWASLLGVERIAVDDNFFELGGHSLLATQVLSRVRQAFRVELRSGRSSKPQRYRDSPTRSECSPSPVPRSFPPICR